ncbi:hypothetical protein [Candidatus Vondammii sp. HM_W22]|nr:hypothetical protein [Candidatus Vondammii sp. HM_W22]
MLIAIFRFYEELNHFLPSDRRKASIKDCIESMGVPHTEIVLILVTSDR